MTRRLAILQLLVLGLLVGFASPVIDEEQTTATAPLPAGLEVVGDCLAQRQTGIIEMEGSGAGTIFNDVFGCTDTIVSPAQGSTADTNLNVVAAGLAARLGAVMLDEFEARGRDDPVTGVARWIIVGGAPSATPTTPLSPSTGPTPTDAATSDPSPNLPEPLRLAGLDPVTLARSIRDLTHDARVVLVEPAIGGDRFDEGLRVVARDGGILLPRPAAGADLLVIDLVAEGFHVVEVGDTDDSAAATVAAPDHPLDGREVWVGVNHNFAPAWLSIPVIEALSRPIAWTVIDGDPRAGDPIRGLADHVTLRWLDPSDTVEQWQFETVVNGLELPGGGYTVFPGRRFVAMYGHPEFGGLGVLGEQGPAAAVDRAQQIAAAYEELGDVTIVPAFDIITTLASGSPTPDGDYSAPLSVEVLRPWIAAATEAGLYVTLDFQPGRTPYIEQVPLYEEFLLLPNVGVALDPEWRLGPNQVHLQQIGSTSAAEINAVAEYLAGLVREHALPQKLLMVHQFRLDMIRDRGQLETHPELALLIHMDGQGAIATKDETYRAITQGFADRVWWGWKNFYDEDSPTPSPAYTMDRDPAPVFISYQ
ncbi:MAG TPA: hypothetical protein VGA36_00440 [Nitriliruptorales bacterium]